MSLSTNVSNLATRIATEVKAIRTLVNGNVADLSALDTTAKSNLVLAINELKTALDTAASDISALESADVTLGQDISAVDAKVGILSLLSTTDKTDLVSAINELQSEINTIDLTGLIDDNAVASDSTWSSFKINGLGSSSNNVGELVKRNSTGGFEAGDITANAINTSTINGMGLTVAAGMGAVTIQSGSAEIATFGGDIVLNAVGGGAYVGSSSTGNKVATESYVDTAEADAVTTANAYTDALINDGIPSTSKVWSSDKTYFEINNAVSALVDGAPALLDTLNELAAAINDDASFASTITTALATKADDSTVVKLTGDQPIEGIKTFVSAPVVPDSSFAIAKVDGLQAALDAKASSANVGDTTTNYVTVFEAGLV